MRGFIPLLLALSTSYTTVTALPQPRIVHRDATAKPKYSVVPLEPGDDDPASGDLGGGNGNGNGNGGSSNGSGGGSSDNDGDGVVTVIRTVTRKPVTKIVTQTEKPSIITAPGKTVTKAVPTTVSVVNMDDEPVTETVTVSHPSSKPKAPEKPTITQKPGTNTDEREPIIQSPTDLSSAAAPGVTSQPRPQPQPVPQPEPEPESPTNIESPQTTETFSAPASEPTTLLTQTSEGARAPEQTERPAPDAPVAPIPSQETFAEGHATQDESWSTAAVPYEPPVAPTTFITFTTTTTSNTENSTPEPSSASKTHDNGAWHTSYPAWNGTALAI
ncbi:uncharacterized protein BKA55DRAFT_496432 [Fusarium redolens]|uniref:Uncharacterized protein n=1 Tax=Fusarium redolens TaxID=48865 RepID=A0A9P9R8U2_FUSRE|nr:uncharacterized protein BKA55DRAFT_496432 [Fusarium redolens]KAH7270082.1 hypothetical protein BKA55DRAFT_496432 [Fusarium redolens]